MNILDKNLIEKIKAGDLKGVKDIIATGVDYRAENDHALIYSAQYGHLDILQFFVAKGLDINASEGGAISWASNNNHPKVVLYLLENDSVMTEVSVSNSAALGHLEIIKILVAYGASMEIVEKSVQPAIVEWRIEMAVEKLERDLSIKDVIERKTKI